jgi:hypothetical protein
MNKGILAEEIMITYYYYYYYVPVANPKLGPDYSVFITIQYLFLQFYIPRKMLSRTP